MITMAAPIDNVVSDLGSSQAPLFWGGRVRQRPTQSRHSAHPSDRKYQVNLLTPPRLGRLLAAKEQMADKVLRVNNGAAITSLIRRAAKQAHPPLKDGCSGGGVKALVGESERRVHRNPRHRQQFALVEGAAPDQRRGRERQGSRYKHSSAEEADRVRLAMMPHAMPFPDDWPVPVCKGARSWLVRAQPVVSKRCIRTISVKPQKPITQMASVYALKKSASSGLLKQLDKRQTRDGLAQGPALVQGAPGPPTHGQPLQTP